MNLSLEDKNLIWHPFTQEKITPASIHIKHGENCYLYDENGKKYLDLISSWWVNLHGHANKIIADAIYKQALQLEHVIFAGFTHDPAVKLCQELQKILPGTLQKFFFSDNGSTAVEVALKMSYQYWINKNHDSEKKIFLALRGDYHGDTFGSMSASLSSDFHSQFKDLFFEFHFIETPYDFFEEQSEDALLVKEEKILQELDIFLQINYYRIASFICEPLIQGANGMTRYRAEFLNKLVFLLRKYDILIILDEVMTGFGRTGTTFAFEQCNFTPDIICLSKGLTGGFLPMALTITTNNIYNAFLGDDYSTSLPHGHSYTANPLGCAASIASLELLLSSKTQEQIKMINAIHNENIENLKNNKSLQDFRVIGTIAAFTYNGPLSNLELKKIFLEHNFLIRPIKNHIYLLPPYSIDKNDLVECYEKLETII